MCRGHARSLGTQLLLLIAELHKQDPQRAEPHTDCLQESRAPIRLRILQVVLLTEKNYVLQAGHIAHLLEHEEAGARNQDVVAEPVGQQDQVSHQASRRQLVHPAPRGNQVPEQCTRLPGSSDGTVTRFGHVMEEAASGDPTSVLFKTPLNEKKPRFALSCVARY